jgi:U3 small nucleolar RNA-associated protein MPP10
LALPAIEPTPLESLFIDGLDEEQIWAQISLRSNKICELLGKIFDEQSVDSGLSQDEESDEEIGEVDEGEDFEGFAAGEEMEVDGSMEEFGGSEEDEDEEDETEDEEDDELDDEDLGEDITPLRGESDEEDDNLPTMFDLMREKSSPKSKKHRKASSHGLDDDFFNLDAFNAEIERLEAKKVSSGRLGDEEDDDSDGDLPIDLFSALNSAENLDEDDVEGDASST